MDKEMNREDIETSVDVVSSDGSVAAEPAVSTDANVPEPVASIDALEAAEADIPPRRRYMPKFTDASDNYRMKGDVKIRERLGLKPIPEAKPEPNPDEIKLDPTAEFEADLFGVEAFTPERTGRLESDESINVNKLEKKTEEEEDLEAQQAREEIEKLLKSDSKPKPKPESEEEAEEELEEESEVVEEEPETSEEPEEYEMADPDNADFGVFDFTSSATMPEEEDAPEGVEDSLVGKDGKGRVKESEFNNPTQRDAFKDRFLDSLISIRIRTGASIAFAVLLFVLEVLSATKVLTFKLFGAVAPYSTMALVDLLLAACLLVLTLPEIIRGAKHLANKKLMPDLLPLPAFVVLGLYTLTVVLTGATAYPLFGVLFATITIPLLTGALYRTKADFVAFKMISQPEEKQIIDRKNTRELTAENMALDGVVDEYKSKTARTFRTNFISDFFKNSGNVHTDTKHVALIYGIPFGVAIVAGLIAYFLSWSFVTAVAVVAMVVMLGCPAIAIIANKLTYFHTQRAALLAESTAIGEDAYHNFSSVDVFAFDDTDIFGPDDVNLKRFMLYGERDSMDKVMRQMSALFASVGGPLDYMFSNVVDNRARHKSATNLVIEDDGICGDVSGHKICAGSEDYMRRNGIAIPAAATAPETGISLDTIKVMYAAEDGEVYAKFYIRYSFSEEFTMTLPSLRESGIIPLIYTRDPNVSGELLSTLTAGNDCMRVVKLYRPLGEEKVYNRVSASMVTYGDKLDAASMIVLSKKYNKFSMYTRFAELCAMVVGLVLAVVLSFIGFGRATILIASIWQIAWCISLRLLSKTVFIKESEKNEENSD